MKSAAIRDVLLIMMCLSLDIATGNLRAQSRAPPESDAARTPAGH